MFSDLISQLLRWIRSVVPVGLLGFGCQSGERFEVESNPIPVAVFDAATADVKSDEQKQIGKFMITFYYVVGEEEVLVKAPPPAANDNQGVRGPDEGSPELASIQAPSTTKLFARNGNRCEEISEVTQEFAAQLRIQGTGKLKDGRVLNIWGSCPCDTSPCFKVTAAQWGTSGTGHQLHPFRTVAVDPKVIKLGTLLYVPLLEGRTMPGRAPWGGFVHDGCVVADDVGGGIKGNQLDLFVGRKGWFLGMSGSRGSHSWAQNVPVFDGSQICERRGRQVARRAGGV